MYNLPMSPATAEAVSKLPSETLTSWLKQHGWREAGPFGKYAVRFLSPDPETEKTVIVPVDKDVADYGWLMINALIEAAKHHEATSDDIFQKILIHDQFQTVFAHDATPGLVGEINKIATRVRKLSETAILEAQRQTENNFRIKIFSRITPIAGMPVSVSLTPGAPKRKAAK
jgi:hypothetical protein